MNLVEREATESDKDWLWKIYQNLLKPCITAQWGWDENFQNSYFETELPLRGFVIYSNFGIDAAASLVKNEPDHYYVKMLLVERKYQGMGIGRLIMERLIAKAKRNEKAIFLSVIKANDVTGFYEKLGFTIAGEDDGSIKYEYVP